jgi:tripartite ATP-independent transporter DctM subunit
MFAGLAPWITRIPGRLMHVNILGCGLFAAVCGSSSATCATIGRMTVPELKRLGYDERAIIGTLAASSTLGLMIPPSIGMIVYGVVADVSITKLFIAGVVPGLLLVGMLMGYVIVWALLNPERTPRAAASVSWLSRLYDARYLLPVLMLVGAVLGSIYAGLATPTEAAALGVAGALLLSAFSGTLNWRSFAESVVGATRTSCMIGFITVAASFLSTAMGYSGIPKAFAEGVAALDLSRVELIVVLSVLYTILGCFLEGTSMLVLTGAVVMPLVHKAGIDPVWFGIYLIVILEISLLTPPVGINLFVLQGMSGRDLMYVASASFPYLMVLFVFLTVIVAFPGLVLYLPQTMQ